jgi:O-succinylbenzoate synthase
VSDSGCFTAAKILATNPFLAFQEDWSAGQCALASLQNFNYLSNISASSRYWEKGIIDPEFMINSDGTLDVPAGPGLGVEINEKILNRLVLSRETIRL